MSKLIAIVAGFGLAVAALPTAASAQGFQSINQRQSTLYGRINQGVRTGALNRNEAVRLRTSFIQLVRLEQRYRQGGLSRWERTDLDRRYDALSARVRVQKHDRNSRR